MCDYSLMAIPNRLAVSGENLVVHRFEAGAVLGLAAPCDLHKRQEYRKPQPHGFWPRVKDFFNPPDAPAIPAICIPPGARLLVQDLPARLQREFGFHEQTKEAVFTQIGAAANTFRDAIRFQNGVEVLLQRFAEGQRVRVLDLSSTEDREAASHGTARERVSGIDGAGSGLVCMASISRLLVHSTTSIDKVRILASGAWWAKFHR